MISTTELVSRTGPLICCEGDDELDYKEFQQLMQMQLDGRSKILVEIWERFDRSVRPSAQQL